MEVNKIKLAELHTQVLQDHSANTTEIGAFELEVSIKEPEWNADTYKWGRWKMEVSRHLAAAIQDTEVPAEYWLCYPTLEMQKAFGIPEVLPMGVYK